MSHDDAVYINCTKYTNLGSLGRFH